MALYPDAQPQNGRIDLLSAEELAAVKPDDLVMVSFSVRADRSTKIPVTIQNGGKLTVNYYANPQWSRITIPVKAVDLTGISAALRESAYLTAVHVENLGSAAFETVEAMAGQWLLEPETHLSLPEAGAGVGRVSHLVRSGNFVYAVSNADGGKLTVVDVTDPAAPKLRGSLDGLGGNTRRAALCASGTDLIVVSRQDGAHIIDVSDPDQPRIRTHYNSVEYATGIAVDGDTAYICNRTYGVEIVDLTDLDHPVERGIIRSGEVQNCCAYNGVLYCGCFAGMTVDLFDVSDPDKITKLGSVPLSGKGDSMAVRTIGGRTYLYAATGQHSEKSLGTNDKIANANFGQGNGLDIFDVTDPKNPVWLSTSRIDGRYYFANNDYWDVRLSVQGEKVYAYYTDTYNGLYVFDVSDPAAPIRLGHVDIPIPTTSPNYKSEQYSTRDHIFPYDQSEGIQSPVGVAEIDDGTAYLAGVYTDLHICQDAGLFHSTAAEPVKKSTVFTDDRLFAFDGGELADYRCVSAGEMTNGIALHGDHLIVGAGKSIRFYSQGLDELAVIPTDFDCYGVAVHGDMLYAAEGTNGLQAYEIRGTSLTKQWDYQTSGTVRGVRVSENGSYVAIQAGSNRFEIISTATHSKAQEGKASMMYFRNLEAFGNYLGFWGYSGNETWYDCGDESGLAVPKKVNAFKTVHPMNSGSTHYEGKNIMVGTGGYYYADPLTATNPKKDMISVCSGFRGRPVVSGRIMICCDRVKGLIYLLDISDIQKPAALATVEIPGNPDEALVIGDTVFIPAGQMGLLKFSLAPYRK